MLRVDLRKAISPRFGPAGLVRDYGRAAAGLGRLEAELGAGLLKRAQDGLMVGEVGVLGRGMPVLREVGEVNCQLVLQIEKGRRKA